MRCITLLSKQTLMHLETRYHAYTQESLDGLSHACILYILHPDSEMTPFSEFQHQQQYCNDLPTPCFVFHLMLRQDLENCIYFFSNWRQGKLKLGLQIKNEFIEQNASKLTIALFGHHNNKLVTLVLTIWGLWSLKCSKVAAISISFVPAWQNYTRQIKLANTFGDHKTPWFLD